MNYLVNNGGGQFIMPAEHMTERGWDAGWKRASLTTLLCQIGFLAIVRELQLFILKCT